MPVASNLYYHLYQEISIATPPVVLIHGAGGNHLYWPPEIRRLPGFRIFAPDLPGHGKSEGRGQQSIQSYARSILEWLASLDIYQAVFVGHSMGGAIALELGVHYPDHVVGLGLVGTGARLQVNPSILEKLANPTTHASAIDRIVASSFYGDTDPRLVELAAKRMAETRPSVLQGDFLACDTFDVTEQLNRINLPTLVLCGAEDKMTPVRFSQMLAGAIPSARLEVIAEAGHMVQLEQPQVVAEALLRFLQAIPYLHGKIQ